jgi:hypothetical protein
MAFPGLLRVIGSVIGLNFTNCIAIDRRITRARQRETD